MYGSRRPSRLSPAMSLRALRSQLRASPRDPLRNALVAHRKSCNNLRMTDLFKTKPATERKSIRYEIRLTAGDAEKISKAAKDRQLSVAEYMRRTALGRRADVNYEVDLVLALLQLNRAINSIGELHKQMIARGITPPVDDWRPVKNEIRQAVVRIAQREPYDFS